ncbi:MAG: FHA domain-containing protein [Caldilineaceae bacterium]
MTDRYGPVVTSAPINVSRQGLPTPSPTPLPTATATALPTPTLALAAEHGRANLGQCTAGYTANPGAAHRPAAGVGRLCATDWSGSQCPLGADCRGVLTPAHSGGGVAGVFLRRRRRPAYDAMHEPISVWADPDATQPADLDDATNPAIEIFARATLVLERGGSELPKEIHLHTQQVNGEVKNEWKIGRSYAYSNYVIEDRDKRVSRWHATIFERADQFYIRDEGSAGGTYVNRNKIEPRQETPLAHNDVINFNTVAYRFVVGDGPGSAANSPSTDPDATEITESLL